MKKILVISLLLCAVIGIFAQGESFVAMFDLATEDAIGYHESVGFKVCTINTYAGNMEMWDENSIYSNWTALNDQNTGGTIYVDGNDSDTPGRIGIQMATLALWSVFPARFYFMDADGLEYSTPIDVVKPGSGATYQHPDVIAWGGAVAPDPTDPYVAGLVAPGNGDLLLDPTTVLLEWTAPVADDNYSAADGYKVMLNGSEVADVTELTFNPTLNYGTAYTWQVIPYTNEAPTKGAKKSITVDRGDAADCPTWNFTTALWIDDEEIPADLEIPVVGDGVTQDDVDAATDLALVINAFVTEFVPTGTVPETFVPGVPEVIVPAVPVANFAMGFSLNQGYAGQYTVSFTTNNYTGGTVYVGGAVTPATWNGFTFTIVMTFTGAKEPQEIQLGDATLPVTLSSFSAVAHSDEYVTLNWITESESNLLGYNIYRSENNDQATAVRINGSMEEATNTTETHSYNFTDVEVVENTYYYWLEVAELSNESEFHGPVTVKVEGTNTPELPSETVLGNPYPTPFSASTQADLRVKEGEVATVTVYNLLGQVVQKTKFNAGTHTFEWNGRDSKGNRSANGIYFFRMSTPTSTKSYKVVKIK